MVNALFAALGRGAVRFRWVIVVVWIFGTGFAVHSLPTLSSQIDNNNSAFLPSNAPSNQAAVLAEPLIGSVNQAPIDVVAVTSGPRFSASDEAALTRLAAKLRGVPTVRNVEFLGTSPDGRAQLELVVSSVQIMDVTGSKTLTDDLAQAIAHSSVPSDLTIHLAGVLATNVANQQQSVQEGKKTQELSLLFIVLLLLVIFRSVLAPLVTLLPAAIVLQLSGALIGGLGSLGLKISSITQLLLIVLILGAGTDYGLFLVFRVREQMQRGLSPHAAVESAVLRVGESIAASAATVIVALLTLLLASFGIYHDLGAPLAIGIAVMLLAGLTLLPALLAIFGRALFWPSKLYERQNYRGLWGTVAGRLVRRPVLALLVGLTVFGGLAVATTGYKPGGFGGALTAPAGTDAAKGNAALKAHFPQASENPTNVVMRFPTSVWSDPQVLTKATADLRSSGQFTTLLGPLDPAGASVSPSALRSLHNQLGPAVDLPTTPGAGSTVSLATYDLYRATARYVSTDGRTVQWEAGLRAGDPSTTKAIDAVPAIRAAVAVVAHRVGASAFGIAGQAPALADVSSVSDGDLRKIVPVAVLAIGLVLALVLRSLVAPLYLLASVVLSYLASLGLAVLVFIDIGGEGGVTFILPFLMFIFLLALGEDYNILVMSRIREEAAKRPLREAVVEAVGASGSTVTSAGLVLAGTFTVFAVAGSAGPGGSQIRAIGFGLAVGVLLDTFVVRTILVPATVTLLGRWNWWPARMGRAPADPVPAIPTPPRA
jgi:RND superfamily putative drug exporter